MKMDQKLEMYVYSYIKPLIINNCCVSFARLGMHIYRNYIYLKGGGHIVPPHIDNCPEGGSARGFGILP